MVWDAAWSVGGLICAARVAFVSPYNRIFDHILQFTEPIFQKWRNFDSAIHRRFLRAKRSSFDTQICNRRKLIVRMHHDFRFIQHDTMLEHRAVQSESFVLSAFAADVQAINAVLRENE